MRRFGVNTPRRRACEEISYAHSSKILTRITPLHVTYIEQKLACMNDLDGLGAALVKGMPFTVYLKNGWRYDIATADQLAFPRHGDFAVFRDPEQNWHVIFADAIARIEQAA
jgi:hypothetical protein